MGLDTSHGCWSGAYSAFHRWRSTVAEAAGLPRLDDMEGYKPGGLPWASLGDNPLVVLLNHSDCEGVIPVKDCAPLADALEALVPKMPGSGSGNRFDWGEVTQRFVNGLRLAASLGEDVEFH